MSLLDDDYESPFDAPDESGPIAAVDVADEPFHFSSIKWLCESALSYKRHLAAPRTTTAAMRRGTIVHRLVLGGPMPDIVESRSKRDCPEWARLLAEHPDRAREAVTEKEIEEARPYADAVLAHPVAREYLAGAEYEVPLEWEAFGRRCRTRGVDILARGHRHGDLKPVRSVRPERIRSDITGRNYHAQVRWIDIGLRARGHTFTAPPFLLCVEGPPVYDIVVVELHPADLVEGDKALHAWMERLSQAESSGEWPGYVTAPIRLEAQRRVDLSGVEEEDEEEFAA